MAIRHRQDEARLYTTREDRRAPRPRLLDSIYDNAARGPTLRDDEPVFDAANCLKLGRDVLFLVSNTGNVAGARWLQEFSAATIGSTRARRLRVPARGLDGRAAASGAGMLCPKRVTEEKLPAYFVVGTRSGRRSRADPGPSRVAGRVRMDRDERSFTHARAGRDRHSQVPLMRVLERHGIRSLPIRLRHMRTLGGGPTA